jgi:uncharacterized protein YfbU (UPF0304 family)
MVQWGHFMELTPAERLILSNQYLILEALYPGRAG